MPIKGKTRKDGQLVSGRFEILTLFFRRCSPCLSSPGRSRILCLSWAWSRALRFHRKPASNPSSAGSESSMVPLSLFLSVLELLSASSPAVYCVLTRTAARARSPFPHASRTHSATCICNRAQPSYWMYSAARDAAPPNGSRVPSVVLSWWVYGRWGVVTGAENITSLPPLLWPVQHVGYLRKNYHVLSTAQVQLLFHQHLNVFYGIFCVFWYHNMCDWSVGEGENK